MPGSSAGRPATVAPKATVSCPQCRCRSSAQAACTKVLSVTF